MYHKKCAYCKKDFYAKTHQTKYCCMKCKRAAQSQRDKERAEDPSYLKKTDNKPKSNINEINRKAREAGMSYGKYVAMKYIEEHRNGSAM